MASTVTQTIASWVAGIGGACFLLAIPVGFTLQALGFKAALGVGELVCFFGALVGFLAGYFFLGFPWNMKK